MGLGRRVTSGLWQWSRPVDGNQKSCVLQVEANGERLLLTGDIDRAAERAFLDSPLAVPTDWLQAPHHGSRSSSSMALLKRLAAQGGADLPRARQCVRPSPSTGGGALSSVGHARSMTAPSRARCVCDGALRATGLLRVGNAASGAKRYRNRALSMAGAWIGDVAV